MYQRSKLKKKMLGNINFIGELFNLGMLSSKIIISQVCWNMCFNLQLLRNCDSTIICGYLIRISSILTANEFLFLALLLFNLPIFFLQSKVIDMINDSKLNVLSTNKDNNHIHSRSVLAISWQRKKRENSTTRLSSVSPNSSPRSDLNSKTSAMMR